MLRNHSPRNRTQPGHRWNRVCVEEIESRVVLSPLGPLHDRFEAQRLGGLMGGQWK